MTIRDKGWPPEWIITNKYLILYNAYVKDLSGSATPGDRGAMVPPFSCVPKRKKGDKGKKERVS